LAKTFKYGGRVPLAGLIAPNHARGRELAPLVPLALVTGISPLATDMYIPGLPELAADLHTTPAIAQLTLTAFLVSYAVGQLLIGPLSDAIGRRRLVLLGTLAFAAASVLCALSPTASVLLVARVVQGLAGAAGSVAGRAMVTDVLAGVRRARVIAALSAINAVGPVVAPLIGGALLGVGTWRLSFWLLAGVGLALFGSVLASFPETLPPDRRSEGVGLAASGRRMGSLLTNPRFTLYLVTSCVATVGFFAYIATSAFVFQTFYGFSASLYTVVFATNAACMIISTLIFGRVVGRVSEDRLLTIGLAVGAVASAGVLAGALLHAPAGAVWACLALVTGAQGLVITGSATRTQALGQASPGSAAALAGGLAFGVGGLGTPLAGLLGGSPTAMGAVMLAGLGLGLALQTVGPRWLARRLP
jgi:DHA1 family bicyclomycin/chloramphenicol resistance-like MFS transporter